jgi:large subunit ribosomal protein L1
VHLIIGKKSFDERAQLENNSTLIEEIVRARPSAAKGRYIRTVTLTTTLGPGVHVDTARTRGIVEELEQPASADSSAEAATVTA